MLIKKELSELALSISEPEYRQLPAWSYSTISAYDREGVSAISKEPEQSISLLKGSVLDTLLTDNENFNNLFFKYDGKVPEGNLLNIATDILNCNEEWEYFTPDQLKAIARANDYGADNWKAETIKNKLEESIKPYVDAMRIAGNRKVISEEIYQTSLLMQEKILEMFYPFFRNFPNIPHIKTYNQLKFMSSYNGIPIRCMFDCIIVDYEKKVIIPADLKTTYYNESHFVVSMLKWRYFYQGFMYSYILREIIKQDDYFKDFTILPFRFMVISENNMNPFMYVLEKSDIPDYVMPSINDNYTTIRPWQEVLEDLDKTAKLKSTYKTIENNGLLYVQVLDSGIVISNKTCNKLSNNK